MNAKHSHLVAVTTFLLLAGVVHLLFVGRSNSLRDYLPEKLAAPISPLLPDLFESPGPCMRLKDSAPSHISDKVYRQVEVEGKQILHYLLTTLHHYDVPLVLLFGTVLHEYRDNPGHEGAAACVQPHWTDDDFDIGVLREHFHYIVLMLDDIRKRFGWHTVYGNQVGIKDPTREVELTFLTLIPPNTKLKQGFQIDIYALHVNHPREGLVDFAWDEQIHDASFYFPFQRHKPVYLPPGYDTNIGIPDDFPVFYMPFDADCLLTNLYTSTYMTPQRHKSDYYEKNLTKVGRPYCGKTRTDADRVEWDRQISYLNKTYGFEGAAESIYWKNTQGAYPIRAYKKYELPVPATGYNAKRSSLVGVMTFFFLAGVVHLWFVGRSISLRDYLDYYRISSGQRN